MRTTGRATCKELLCMGSSTLDCPMGSPARYIICILYTCECICDLLSTGSHKCTSGIGGSSRLGSGNSSYSYSSVVFVVDLKVVVVV